MALAHLPQNQPRDLCCHIGLDPRDDEIGEQAHFGVFQAAVLAEGGKLRWQRRGGNGNRDQCARTQVVGNLENRLQHDTPAIEGPTGQHIAIIGFERPGDIMAARAFGGLQRPLKFLCSGKAQVEAIVLFTDKGRAIRRIATPGYIGRCGTQNARAIGNQADLEA